LFLRTSEFLWQEGHTAHETEAEAEEETLKMLGVYRKFAEEFMAIPVITGLKTDSERFAGALRTYCIEAMMQDNKALQAGTSHNLGQNFSKAFDLKFQGRDGSVQYAWNTSWGVSTRLVGGIIMTHSDDDGLVLPPRLAPTVAVIVPIFKTDEERASVLEAADAIYNEMRSKGFRVKIDKRDNMSPGAKYYEWELKGVPLRIEIGPKDVANKTVVIVPRITLDSREAAKPGRKQKLFVSMDTLSNSIEELSSELQAQLLKNAIARREANTIRGVKTYEEMKEIFSKGEGAFVYAGWNGDPAIEAKVKEETKATIRCIPDAEFRSAVAPATCLVTGEKAKHEVIWSKAY
ncbi:MAG: His/Gly/Thr/Pro-type tRNA ligase C-terminal domain-containing protein, partial [Bacteroidota bacterium]|nr:His/Gly/Thr/Pro-type tRNA ligase C-terminal domain-containing protein [Bacteroidota bacterium]